MEDLKRSYSSLAPTYDVARFSGRSGRFLYETDRRIVCDAIATAAPAKILDVPTGTGRVLDYLRNQPASITGVDSTPEMLLQAARYARAGKDELLIGNAAALAFEDDSFDCVVSLRFFHLFSRQERVPFAKEFCRVVRPGGYLLLSMTNGWYAGGINWLKQYLGMRTVSFEYPGELSNLFRDWRTVRVEGNFLPFQSAASSVPVLGSLLRWSSRRFPLNHLCYERFYLLRKP